MEYSKLLSLTLDEKMRHPNTFHYDGDKCPNLHVGNNSHEKVIIKRAQDIGGQVKSCFAGVSDNECYVVGLRAMYEDSKEDSNPFSQNYYIRRFEKEDEFVRFFIQHKDSGYDNHIDRLS